MAQGVSRSDKNYNHKNRPSGLASESFEIDIAALVHILVERKFLIIFVTLLCLVLSQIALMFARMV